MSIRPMNRRAVSRQADSTQDPARRARRRFFNELTKRRPRRLMLETLDERRVLATMYASSATSLLTFDSATPATITSTVAFTGLGAGEVIRGIDVRPATGQLYGLGITDDGATRTGRIYTINPTTAVATAVGPAFSTTLLDTSFWGFDFNPTVDRIRIVNDLGSNLRVNPNNGALAGTDTNLNVLGIDGVAYDRNVGSAVSTLYAYDFNTDQLATIGGIDGTPSPNLGVVTDIGATGITAFDSTNLDIESVTNIARLASFDNTTFNLYTVNLATGAATLVGPIGAGLTQLFGLTSASTTAFLNGTTGDDTITLVQSGTNIVATGVVNGPITFPIAGLTGITVSALAGNDTVNLDFSGGNPFGSLATFATSTENVIYTGTAGDDTVAISTTGVNAFTASFNSGAFNGTWSGLTSFTFNGGGANDNLSLTYNVGGVLPIINYDGGVGGLDTLTLGGGLAVTTVTHNFTNANDGSVNITGQGNINYLGLDPIVDNMNAANRIFNFNGGAETITLGDDATPSNNVSRIQSTLGELVDFLTPTATLTINSGAGPDIITLNGPDALFNTPAITVNASTSIDTINVIATRTGTTTTINAGDGLDNINIGNTGTIGLPGALTPVNGAVVVNGQADGANLVVDGSGAGVTANYAITSTTVTRSVPPNFGGVTYGGISTLLLEVGAGANIIDINSTAAGVPTTVRTNAGGDTLNVAAAALQSNLSLNGGGDDDVFNITGVSPATVTINIDGGLQATADGDLINIVAGTTANTVRHFLDTSATGRIEFDGDITDNGGAAESIVNYIGLEPINDNANAVNRVFDFGAGNDNDVAILDDAGVGNNITRIQAPANAEAVNFLSPTASLTVNLGAGLDVLSVNSFDAAFPGGITINLNGQDDADEIRLGAAPATSTVNIDTALGVPDVVTIGRTGAGTAVALAQFNQVALGTTLAAILATNVNINDASVGETYVDNSGDATNGRTFNFDNVAAIPVFAVPGIALTSPGYLVGSINVGDNSADGAYQFADGNGSSTHNIDLDIGDGFTSAQFFGNGGDDIYNLNINNAQPAGQPEIIIHGNGSNFAATGGRDVVNINEIFNLGAVSLGVTYTGGVGGTEALVTGLGRDLRIDTSETIRYAGNGNDNSVIVTGTAAGDDLISVTPVSANRALVFNGGNPFDGPPEDNATSIPGVSGGSVAPDLDLSGLVQATGLNIQDAGVTTGDRLYVYGESEADLVDGRAFDPFGFGAGVIMNGVAVPGSYDDIFVDDNSVLVDNFVQVNFDNADFVQADPVVDPAVVVNAGFETTNSVGVADDITVTPSAAYKFQINGGDPDPATTMIVPPNGDRLNFGGVFDVVNVWATKDAGGGPPVITLDFPGTGSLPISFSSIEDFGALTANTVNLIGDNNDPAVDQNDDFVVVGRNADNDNSDGGYQEFQLFINNSIVPLSFNGVQFLNVFGDDQNPPPGTPSAGNDIDTLELTPYADDTPRGWGIDVSFDEGNPAGADGVQDLLILHTSLFGGQVSENIVIKPAGPDNGEIIVTNASFGTPIVDIDYVANTDIIIRDDDGFVNDTDTLTLLGTNPDATLQATGNDTFDFNADALMTLADPLVTVSDTDNGNILYRLREFTVNGIGAFISGITVDGQGGNDIFNLTGGLTNQQNSVFSFRGGSGNDSLNIDMPNGFMFDGTELNYDGGTGSDLLTVQNSAALGAVVTTTQYFVGTATGSGQLVYDDGVLDDMTITFVNLEPVIDLVDSAELIVTANNADNAINYSTGAVATNGLVSIDDHEVIEFSNKIQLTIDALAGSDTISLQSQTVPTDLTTIEVNGGDPTASDKVIVVGTTGTDTITYTPNTFNSATLVIATRPTVNLFTVEHVVYDSGETVGFDQLTINGTIVNDILTYDAGLEFGGTHRSVLGPDLDFLRTGRITFNGNGAVDVVNYLGSDGVDTVTATAAAVTLVTPGSTAIITFGPSVEVLNLSTFAGNDSITLTTFAGAATVVNAGDGNDTVLGSTLVDSLYGGPGNDILVGGGGDDFLYGEEGNDIFGNTTLTPNGVADDPGVDSAFGGEGFDNFVWEPGDGADINNGGGDAADIFRFFGNASANAFILRSGGTATHFNALIGAVNIDNHGIEDVVVDGQGGGDTYTVEDLFATEVVSINLVTTAGALDTVTLNARNVSDNISLASPTATRVAVSGLRYNVNVDNAAAADGDVLIVNGNDGDDSISSPASLLTFFTNANLRLNGGLGNDTLVGNGATISGGLGNDSLTGGVNNDVFDGGEGDDTFVGGGGTDNVGGGAGSSVGDTILVGGTSGNDTVNLSLSVAGLLVATVNGATTTYGNFIGGPIASAGIEQILVQGQAGNDGLTVNSLNGAVPVLITFDGGNNNDTLTLTGGTATSDTYAVGSTPDRGTSTIVIGGVTQTVGFLNIEPVIDLVAGPLVVVATNADNAINYGPGSVAANGLVSVDGFETIEFSNKTTLTINALAGNDTIAINPASPTGLTGVTVNGGNPGAGDTLIISGTIATEAFEYAPTGENAGTVTIATRPVITFGTISAVTIDGGSTATDDTLVVRSEGGGDTVTLTPGANFDAGTVDISSLTGTESTPRLTFLGLGQDATLTLLSGAGAGAREDEFVYNGTANSDAFGVSAAGAITLNSQIVVNANGAIELRLNGLNGDDLFTVPGNHPFAVGILVDGGNPSAGSDVLNFLGAGAAITVNLPTVSITETGFGPVSYLGVEDVAINGGAAALTVNGTTADDRFDVQPTAAGAGSLRVFTTGAIVTTSPQFTYTNVNNAAFTLNGNTGFDDVHLLGNNGVDTITATATTVTRAGGTVTFGTALERLNIDAFDGDDSIDVSAFTSTNALINGGLGNDTIVGTGNATGDLIYGGSGNDLLRGGAGADTIYGEDGNDTFGIVSAVAQDAGGDFFFGGDGSDLFIWNPGDGNDLFEGGAGEADRLQFQGNAAANSFIMNAVDTRLEFLFGAVDLDLASTEEVQINTLAGGDTVTINDLDTTEVRNINVDLFVTAGEADTVTINGRNVSDNISLATTAATRVAVTGLKYAVNVDNPLATDGDILIVNGNDGNDSISSPASLLTFFTNANLRLNGNVGNDNILGNGASMFGGVGDDFITGGVNNDIMDGGEGDDTFVGGGGTDNVGGGAGSSVGDTILVAGTNGADTVNLSLSATGQLIATVNGATTTYNNFAAGPIATSGIEQILVQAQAGNDGLTVNSANGAVPILITYDGGNNNDSLTLVGGVATSDTYSVGSTPDRGTSVIVIGGVTQTVGFLNIEPVVDLVAGPLTVVATNSSNAINYSRGPNAGNPAAPFGGVQTGLVSIDGFETIEFSNKETLTINALAGDDVINLNYQQAGAAPLVGPTGLGVGLPAGTFAITVNAGDPTASDKLIVNGTAGIAEVQTLFPTAQGAGNLISLTTVGLVQVSPTVAYTGVEDLAIVMQGGDGDGVRITGTANNDVFEVTPGVTPDAGRVNGTMAFGAPAYFNLPNITYSGNTIATPAAAGLPASVGALGINSGPAATQGGVDSVVYNGTSENDIFTVSNEGVTLTSAAWAGPNTPPVLFGSGVNTSTVNIVINAGNGDDRINMVSATAGTETYDFNGGNPSSGSDTLALVDPAAIAGAPNLAQTVFILPDVVDPTQQDIFGYSANLTAIDVTGIELITYTGDPGVGGVRDDILVVGPNADNDQVRVSSQSAGVTARVTSQRLPEVHFTTLSAFFVDVGLGNAGVIEGTFVTRNLDPGTSYNFVGRSEDILIIEGADTFPDNYVVSNGLNLGGGGGIVLVTDMSTGPGPVVAVAGGLAGAVAPGFFPGEVRLNTRAGDDRVTIDTGAGGATAGAVYAPAFAAVGFPLAPVDLVDTRIVYNGGTGGDVLRVVGTPATAVTNQVYTPGPDPTSGRIDYGTAGRAANLSGTTLTGMMQVEFTGLQPVIDVVPATNLTVNASNANNVVTYSQGPNTPAVAANTGLVAIDNNETIEFANKVVLTLNGLSGNDTITLANTGAAVPTGLTQIIATGGIGDDVIDASTSTLATPLRLYGGVGNDTLVGGLGGDALFGELGNDTLVDSPGNDAFDGGNNGTLPVGFVFPALPAGVAIPAAVSDPITATAGFDTIVVRGTGGNDVLAVTQNAATAVAGVGYSLAIVNSAGGAVPAATADVIASSAAGAVPNAVASRPSVEEVRIEAGFGNDEIVVAHSDAYVAATGTGAAPVLAAGAVPQQMVRFDVRGDAPNASDRLTVQDLGQGDLVLLRQAADQRTGRVTVAPAVNSTTLGGFLGDIVYTGIEKVHITPINPLNGGTGTDGLGQVVVFDTDPFEYNDNILNAEDINHIELVTRNPNIDPGHNAVLPVVTPAGNGDEDWYAFTAPQNGTFQINTLFSAIPVAQPNIPGVRPGLPGNGQLISALYAAVGAATPPLVVGSTLLDPLGQVIGQQLQFTAIEGRTYYLRVIGTNATPTGLPAVGSVSTSLSVNTYDISLAQIDNVGPQVFDPDGANFPAQAIQIVDAPLYNLFDNKQTFNSTVLAAPAPTLVGGVLNITSEFNLIGMHIGETVTFTSGVNAGLSDTITAISGNRLTFGSTTNPTIFALPAAGDAFFVGAPTPTPNVNGLTINFRDPITAQQFGVGPGALLGALDPATALNPGNYILRGDANGIIPIQNVRFAVPANGVIGGVALAPTATALNTTISLNAGAGLSVVNGPIVGQTLQFTSGLNTGLSGRITGYNAITGSLRFSSAFPFAIAAGDAFIISPSPIVISPVPVLTTANVTAAGSNVVVNLGVNATTGAGLSTVPGTYVGQALQIISGALAGETRTITAYNGAGVFTVAGGVAANGFSGVPAVGDTINIVGTPATATSTVAAASLANSIVGGAGLPLVNGGLVGQALQFTSGALSGQARVITGYTIVPGIGPVFAFATGFTAAPAVGDSFVIVPAAPAPLANAVQAVIAGQGRFVGGLGGVAGAGLSPLPQAYLGQVLQFTSGALLGQAQVITDYANNTFAFSQPFTANPAVGDTFVILPVNVAAITLDFESPLPDDRYTLTISDEIRDVAGNQLDGNTAASQPTGSPVFPSGDGISGGDFVARFTVDSRPELGTWAAGSMWADINGNQLFDPNNTDFTNRDYAYLLGYTSDELFAGNFANVGATFADGFDKIAAYGRVGTNTWRWLIDTDNDGVPNITQVDPASINGFPVSGDFDLNTPGDEVGLFTGTTWFLDINHSFTLNDGPLGVRQLPWTRNGVQVNGHGFTGDFDGDGAVDLGSWSNDVFSLSLSSTSGGLVDGIIDTQFSFGFPGNRERPVAADMNRDGIDDIGLWVPDRATQTPGEAAEWYWLVSGLVANDTQLPGGLPPFPATLGPTIPERVVADPVAIPGRNIVAFTPTPFGNDLYMQFGDEFSLPIVGNFDPPVEKAVSGSTLTNTNNPLDVNNDGRISAFDALAVINHLNLNGTTAAPTGGFVRAPFLDVNGNGQVTAFDALQVINYLNLHPTGGAAEFVFENDLGGGEDTSGIDDELLMLLAADEDRD